MSFDEDYEEMKQLILECYDWDNTSDESFDERLSHKLKSNPRMKRFYDECELGRPL